MRRILLLVISAGLVFAAEESPTGRRMTPPTIAAVSPQGIARGATVEMTIEGFNLAKASAVYFSEPGIKARVVRVKELPDLPDVRLGANGTASTIDLGPLPPRNQVTVEIDVPADAEIGPVDLRVQTPLGTSPEARFLVEPYYGESPDREPNDTPEEAFETFAPTILVGAIAKPGDFDYYKLNVKAGEELVFENSSAMLGSALQPVIGIYDAEQNLLKEFGRNDAREARAFSFRFEKAGAYYVRVADYQESGSAKHFYRIKVGKFPLVTSVFPLGVQQGKSEQIALQGFGLKQKSVSVKGEALSADEPMTWLKPGGFSRLKVAVGSMPEVSAVSDLQYPVTVNGRLTSGQQDFRFHAKKGQKLVFEVEANRLGSPLDSLLEVMDSAGKPVERATIRSLIENTTTLRDHDSTGAGIRLTSTTGFAVGDVVMLGGELIEVAAMPRGPDDDYQFKSFGGQRLGLLDTTPEAHAIDSSAYKVAIYPPGKQFTPNGLPLVHLAYRNDDGGPGFGKDSRLHFTAPADGEYVLRLRDVRGLKGEDFAYRLKAAPPEPDFQLSVAPKNPNVPMGGAIPVTVTALRHEYDGPIEVEMKGLPAGLSASRAVMGAGQISTTLVLSAAASAKVTGAAPMEVVGTASVGGRTIAHRANPEDKLKLVAVTPKPDVVMTAVTKEVVLEPGKTAKVEVTIERNNEFGGRVPVEVRNLPPGVRVLDVGLNGVLINEHENQRTFTLEALPNAESVEQAVVVSGKIETRADGVQQNSYASPTLVILKVKGNRQLSQVR